MTDFSAHSVHFEEAQRNGLMRAFGIDAHDGDTITALIDLGFGMYASQQLRLVAASGPINTSEIVGTSGPVLARAKAAKDRTVVLTVGQPLLLRTHRTKSGELLRTFARYVAEVQVELYDAPGVWTDVGNLLLEEGLADRMTL